jgi:hypothetical protein
MREKKAGVHPRLLISSLIALFFDNPVHRPGFDQDAVDFRVRITHVGFNAVDSIGYPFG